jgi:hypothetical protein
LGTTPFYQIKISKIKNKNDISFNFERSIHPPISVGRLQVFDMYLETVHFLRVHVIQFIFAFVISLPFALCMLKYNIVTANARIKIKRSLLLVISIRRSAAGLSVVNTAALLLDGSS